MRRTFHLIARGLHSLVPGRADWRAMGWAGVAGALLSAVLMRLAFPKFELWWIAWFGLVPILFVTLGREARTAKWLWYLFGAAYFYLGYSWLNVTMYVNTLVLAGVALAAFILGLYVLLFGWGAWWFRRLGVAGAPLLAVWWVSMEWFRTFGELAFPWLFLAHTQYRQPILIQSASIFGTHALSLLIFTCNVILAEALWRWWRGYHDRQWHFLGGFAAVFAALFALNLWGGARGLARWNRPPGERIIRAALLQPNWSQPRKLEAMDSEEEAADLFRDLLAMLREIEPGSVDLVLMPESVILSFAYPLESPEIETILSREARRLNTTLIFGANNTRLPLGVSPDDTVYYRDLLISNSIWAINPRGQRAGVYDKVRLVAFSETAPLITLIPGLTALTLGQVVFFEPGKLAEPLPVELGGSRKTTVGSFVCFESTFPSIVRQFSIQGAEVLATVTNDGWFLDSAGPYQHWAAQPFRAVENRRWLLRSANTGITGMVDPAGVIASETKIDERTIVPAVAGLENTLTIYARHGDWLAKCSATLCAVLLVLIIATDRRRRLERERFDEPSI